MKTSTVSRSGTCCLLLVLCLACGDYSNTASLHSGANAPANLSATINGVAWQGTVAATTSSAGTSGTYQVSSVSSTNIGLQVFMTNIRGPGTYALGMSNTTMGGTGSVSNGLQLWTTPLTGSAGTVTLTSVSTTRIAGTFSFVATMVTDGISTSKTVTGGAFDLPVQLNSSTPSVPDNAGNNVGGTISGSAWNAASVTLDSVATTHVIALIGTNLDYTVEFDISEFGGAGNYDLNTGALRMGRIISLDGTSKAWGGTAALSNGHFTVTSVTGKRIKGTATMTLQADPNTTASGTMTFTGAFEAGFK